MIFHDISTCCFELHKGRGRVRRWLYWQRGLKGQLCLVVHATAWCHILFCVGQVRSCWPYQPREGLFKEICLPTSEYNDVSGIAGMAMATRFISIMFPVGAPATGSCMLTSSNLYGR